VWLALGGRVTQASEAEIKQAIRAKTPHWRGDRVTDFMRALEARGYIKHRGFGQYELKQIGQERYAPKPEAPAKAEGPKPSKRKPSPARRRIK